MILVPVVTVVTVVTVDHWWDFLMTAFCNYPLRKSHGQNPRGLRPLVFWPWNFSKDSIHHSTPSAFPNNVYFFFCRNWSGQSKIRRPQLTGVGLVQTNIYTKLKTTNCDNSKNQIVTKLKNSNCDKTQKFKLQQNTKCDKTQIWTKLKNSNCDKT